MSWFEAATPTLPDLVRLNARWRGAYPAVRWNGETVTWCELEARCNRVANACAELGLAQGDAVAILMHNSLDMLCGMLGVVTGGYVAVPLNVSVNDAGIATQVRDCDAVAILACDANAPRIDGMLDALPAAAVDRRILAGEAREGWQDFAALTAAASPDAPAITVAPGDTCNVIYSSGTTGLPKGIVHSHACRMAWAWDMSIALRYHSDVRTLISLGLYSNITWVAMLNTLLCGGTLVLKQRFDAVGCLETIAAERVTHAAMVPVQFQRLLELPSFDDYDLSSIQALMCCGSPLHPDLKCEIDRRIPGDFIELYGLTEGLVTIQSPTETTSNPASVGRPCPGQFIEIIGEDDRPLPAGEAGEIVGYGRLLMDGYLKRDAASEEATWTDARGRRWLRTGDIGRVDEAGNLYVVDRKKDMILSGGQNVYPADIEAIIARHPDVHDVAVIGVPSERWGETPLAVVCGNGFDTRALLEWTNNRVGKQQRIAGVVVIDELPRNPNGKVLKRELREHYRDLGQTVNAGAVAAE
jgi:acyl-CoA synthetase (AMP-forming)/AMP-acid ligase II